MKYWMKKNINTPDRCRYKFNNWEVTGTAMRVNKTYAVVLDFDNHGETELERKEIYKNLCKRILPNPNAEEGTLEYSLSKLLYAECTASYGIHIIVSACDIEIYGNTFYNSGICNEFLEKDLIKEV